MTQFILPPLTAVIYREHFSDASAVYVASCPELHITSQGCSIDQAQLMLQEAVMAWLEEAADDEVLVALREGAQAVALMPLEINELARASLVA